MSRTTPLGAGEFVALVGLLMSLPALTTDAMLPALPAIGHDLGAPRRNDVQFVITAMLLGLALGQIVFGPLSDRLGRKPAIHAGLGLYMAGCLMSVFAPAFEVMIASRIVQGIGAAGPRIVVIALVRDQYEGRQMARLMSFAIAVFILVPTVAPALGQGIQWLAGWRAIFGTFFAVAAIGFAWLALRQPETLPAARRRPLSPRTVGAAVLEVMGNRTARGYILATACAFAPFIAYLSSVQQIFQESYRVGALFPVYFGALALAIGGASLMNARLVLRYGMRRITRAAAVCIALVSVIAWAPAFAFDGLPPLWLFMPYLLVVFGCFGLIFGNLNALAMEPLGHIAGLGAAVVASVPTFIAVPFGALVGQSFDGTMYAQISAFAIFGAGAFAAMRWAERGSEQDERRSD